MKLTKVALFAFALSAVSAAYAADPMSSGSSSTPSAGSSGSTTGSSGTSSGDLGTSSSGAGGSSGSAGAGSSGQSSSFTQLDADSSGYIEPAEASNAAGLDFSAADTDADGRVSRTEFEAAMRKAGAGQGSEGSIQVAPSTGSSGSSSGSSGSSSGAVK